MLLAGVLLKMGTYGLIRFSLPLFPNISHLLAPLISLLAIVGIIYGALVAMVQPDMKKLVAYSSVSHLGFIVLGIFSFTTQGMEGAVYQMLNHGVSTGALFLLVGMIYERRHTRMIAEFGGLANRMPVFAAVFLFVTLSSIGLPGLERLCRRVSRSAGNVWCQPDSRCVRRDRRDPVGGLHAVDVSAGDLGRDHQPQNESLMDINGRERLTLVPLLILIVWMGVYSNHFLRPMDASVDELAEPG